MRGTKKLNCVALLYMFSILWHSSRPISARVCCMYFMNDFDENFVSSYNCVIGFNSQVYSMLLKYSRATKKAFFKVKGTPLRNYASCFIFLTTGVAIAYLEVCLRANPIFTEVSKVCRSKFQLFYWMPKLIL